MIVHFQMVKKYKIAALIFCEIQTLIIIVGYNEVFIIIYPVLDTTLVNGLLCFATSLSIMSYNQASFTLMYIFLALYDSMRNFFKYSFHANSDKQETGPIRFSIALLLSFVFITILSRAFNKRQRERFIDEVRQRQVLQLFEKVIRQNHDGVMIT